MPTLPDFERYSSTDFERWLAASFARQHGPDLEDRQRAFDLRDENVPFGESHLDSIEALASRLSPNAAHRLGQGVERLFRHASPATVSKETMADLIALLGRLQHFEALDAFVPVLGSGGWGRAHPSLVYDGLGVLATFNRDQDAYAAIRGLATSSNFRDPYVFDAYAALIRARPQAWIEDLDLLRPRWWRLRSTLDAGLSRQLEARDRLTARNVVRAVPLGDIAHGLPRLKLRPLPDTLDQASSDTWLLEALVATTGPLRITYSDDELALLIVDRNDGGRVAQVPYSHDLDLLCNELIRSDDELKALSSLEPDLRDRVTAAKRPPVAPMPEVLQSSGYVG